MIGGNSDARYGGALISLQNAAANLGTGLPRSMGKRVASVEKEIRSARSAIERILGTDRTRYYTMSVPCTESTPTLRVNLAHDYLLAAQAKLAKADAFPHTERLRRSALQQVNLVIEMVGKFCPDPFCRKGPPS